MPLYLDEMQLGCVGPGDTLGHPNLQSCVGVTALMDDGSMWGVHIPAIYDDPVLLYILRRMMALVVPARRIVKLYVIGAFKAHVPVAVPGLTTVQMLQRIVHFLLGNAIVCYYVDLGDSSGTLASLTSVNQGGQWKCDIKYKKQAKVQDVTTPYVPATHIPLYHTFLAKVGRDGGTYSGVNINPPTAVKTGMVRAGTGAPLKMHQPSFFSLKNQMITPAPLAAVPIGTLYTTAINDRLTNKINGRTGQTTITAAVFWSAPWAGVAPFTQW